MDATASIQFLPVAFPVSLATVHIQICTSGKNKLGGPESKPVKQLGQFSLVKICYNTVGFDMKYCIGPLSIRDKMEFNFDRLRHAQTIGWCLHAFIASSDQKTATCSIDKRFHSFCPQAVLHLPDRAPCSRRMYGMFCKDKQTVLLKCCVFNT